MQYDIHSDQAGTTQEFLQNKHSPKDIVENATWFAEVTTKKYRDPKTSNVACKIGCTSYCYQLVTISPLEAFRIVPYLNTELAESNRSTIIAQLEQLNRPTRGMNAKARTSTSKPCAFLSSKGEWETNWIQA